MDKEHVKGATDKAVGKAKAAVGQATGNKNLETAGKVDQAEGAAHTAAGNAKDAGKEVIQHANTARRKQ